MTKPVGPGWYPDPAQNNRRRYWDGSKWGPYEPEKSGFNWKIAGLIAGVVVAAGIVIVGSIAAINVFTSSPTSPTKTSSGSYTVESASPTPTVAAYTPKPADFKIDIIVTSQKCFGSAGCSYRYTIDPSYIGPQTPSDSAKLMIIYEVHGGEQAQTGSLRLEGGQFHFDRETSIDGEENAQLTATVTKVISQG